MLSLVSISSNMIAKRIITHVMCGKESWDASSAIEEVKKNVMPLKLPHILEELIKEFVKPMSYEVEYYYFHIMKCGVEYNPTFIQKLFFTMDGKINYKLSARQLVLDENLSMKSRIILACKFCCEEEVLAFWRSQPDLFRKLAEQEELTTLANWLKYLEAGEPTEEFVWKDCDLLEAAFFAAVDDINLEAAKYFWKKMVTIPNEKRKSILETATASVESAQSLSSSRIMSRFIARLNLFLAYSIKEVYNLLIENQILKKKMYDAITDNYEILTNKCDIFFNKYDLFVNKSEKFKIKFQSFRNKCEMSLNKEMLNNDKEGLKNKVEGLKKEGEGFINEYEKLVNEEEELKKEREVFMSEFEKLKQEDDMLEMFMNEE